MNFQESITGVVGPNGCGKSNIVDAIRWCMGEQSAKHLRGKAMDDVIFAGSDSRGAASMAEVSLTFEDVGFSAEALELGLADDSMADVDTAPSGDADAPELRSDAVADGWPLEASEDEVPPPPTAEDDAREFLTDPAPAINFAQYSEVTITRRLFRDGTSNYYLNKTPCRLRDITDFFLGTGVGTKAYSIIEQGRVGMIVSARPQDRRHLIDEAAGITKFKRKKKAAERKLEQTRQNLLRVTDIVSELGKRLGSLKRQAQKAERYRRYKSEVKDIELTIASQRYLELDGEEKVLRLGHSAATENLAASRTEYDKRDAEVISERAHLGVE